MPDTARSYADLVTLLADNSSGAISPQDLRDMLKSMYFPMGEISYFNTTGSSVTISGQSDGSTNMVLADPATALSGYEMEFDSPSNGRLRYTGALTRAFHVACTISVAGAGASDTFVFGIARSGTVIAASKVIQALGGVGGKQSTAMHLFTTLSQNQYLELYVGNMTDTDNVTVHSLNLFAMGMIM